MRQQRQQRQLTGYALRAPCANCPFRSDIDPYLRPERAQEIAQALIEGGTFECHKTVDYQNTDEEDTPDTSHAQHCAGALLTMERGGTVNQMMRIAERLGLYDYERMKDDAPVYAGLDVWVHAHREHATGELPDIELELEHCGVVGQDCEDPAGYAFGSTAYGNLDAPTCDPNITCYSCGHIACEACRVEVDDEILCVDCAKNDDEDDDSS